MCDETKRKRSPNWLHFEKTLLLDLMEKHFNIIEKKKTDGVSVKAKLAEWKTITVQYNSQMTHCHREADNLKAQWENMKKAAKKEASNARMHRIQTGGGPPHPKKEDPNYSRIISLITTSAVGLHNPFDNDSVVPIETSEINTIGSESENLFESTCNVDLNQIIDTEHQIVIEEHDNRNNIEVINAEYEVKDWGDYTPQLLRTPISTPLCDSSNGKKNGKKLKNKTWVSKRRPTYSASSSISSLEQLHKKKMEAIEYQKQLATQEIEKQTD